MKKISAGFGFLLVLALISCAYADYVIKLKNGRTVETAKYWEEKDEVKFQWEDGVVSLPKRNIVSILWVEEKFPNRSPRQSQPAAERQQTPNETPQVAVKKVEPATPAEASKEKEIDVDYYKKQKAYYTEQYEQAYQRYLEASSRRDAEAKKKAWEEFNRFGGQVISLETELKEKNNGSVPQWWKE